jgi:hypothetical protein
MSSNPDLDYSLVEDARFSQISPRETFAIYSGAASNTYQQFQANSQSTSALTWSVQIPSENIIVDRRVLIKSTIKLGFTIRGVYANFRVWTFFNPGVNNCLQAFPLNSLFTTVQCTINNNSISTQLQDIKDMMLNLSQPRELQKWNSMTPCIPDQTFALYSDAIDTTSSPFGNSNSIPLDNDFIPRGAYPFTIDAALSTYTPNGGAAVPFTNQVSQNELDTYFIVLNYTLTEPLLYLSPFVSLETAHNRAGLVGINNISFNMVIDANVKRVWSSASYAPVPGTAADTLPTFANCTQLKGIRLVDISDSFLLFNFLSASPEQALRISTRNIVPYMDYNTRFLSTNNQTTIVQPGAEGQLTFSSIQLNQVPNYIVLAVRVPMTDQNCFLSSSFLPISKISVSFNNVSGLLASATTQDLWQMSAANTSTQNWLEFSGYAAAQPDDFRQAGIPNFRKATIGSVLVFDPSKDLSLPSYLTNSSSGQFNLSFIVNFTNNTPWAFTPQCVVSCLNTGMFITEQGGSMTMTGLVNKNDVLTVKSSTSKPDMDDAEMKQLVGGAGIMSAHNGIRHKMHSHLRRYGGVHSGGSGGYVVGGKRSRIDEYL